MGISNIISLLSGIALFLFGMAFMGEGLKKVAGNKMELILYRLSSTPLKGVLLGAGVTAAIQSSSATSVMVVGFVNSGMMKVRQAIGIILGAVLGTSITGWIVSLSMIEGGSGWTEIFSTATLTGVIAVIGIILRMFCKKEVKKKIGNIMMGFAILMYGMSVMSSAVAPLKDSPEFISILTRFSNPLIGILVGLLFTSLLQSASAAVGILQMLAVTGAIDFSMAFPIIMGIAIGAALPVLFSALGANVNGKRSAFVYLLINLLGAGIVGILFYIINAFAHFSFMNTAMDTFGIALLNTVYRLAVLIILLPLIGQMEKIVMTLFKEDAEDAEEMADIDRLEERFIQYPAIAIEQSRTAMNSMASKADKNLSRALDLLDAYSEDGFIKIQEKEDVIDKYEDRLGTYLVKLTAKELNPKQNIEISKCLHTLSDFERIGDHAVNIAEAAMEIHEKKIIFSQDAAKELDTIKDAVSEIVANTKEAFINEDIELASKIEPLEEWIDVLCDDMKMHHVKRIQTGECTLLHGFVFNDLMTNYERIADHCSNIAVAMIGLKSNELNSHAYLNELKKEPNSRFNRYYDQYSQKYSI